MYYIHVPHKLFFKGGHFSQHDICKQSAICCENINKTEVRYRRKHTRKGVTDDININKENS